MTAAVITLAFLAATTAVTAWLVLRHLARTDRDRLP